MDDDDAREDSGAHEVRPEKNVVLLVEKGEINTWIKFLRSLKL
jgi:hypothetical protein